jgi:hypothetical protein
LAMETKVPMNDWNNGNATITKKAAKKRSLPFLILGFSRSAPHAWQYTSSGREKALHSLQTIFHLCSLRLRYSSDGVMAAISG